VIAKKLIFYGFSINFIIFWLKIEEIHTRLVAIKTIMLLLNQGFGYLYFLAQTGESAGDVDVSVSSGNPLVGLLTVIIGIAAYVFTSYCFQKIYDRLGEPNSWFAWVPLLNNWIMYKAGDQSPWWLIALFIPLLNFVAIVFLIIAFVNIVKKLGKNPWLILLMIIPLVNFWVIYQFAFT
jgi:hypothetical protein